MPYTPQTWNDFDTSKPLSAARMGYMESGIQNAQAAGEAAQSTANSASSAASTAQTTANNAQTSANNAQTSANNAQTTANAKTSVGLVLALS